MSKCLWPLGGGETLEFTIYTQGSDWNKVAGLYIFSYRINDTEWRAVYVGQTDDFSSRIPNHENGIRHADMAQPTYTLWQYRWRPTGYMGKTFDRSSSADFERSASFGVSVTLQSRIV